MQCKERYSLADTVVELIFVFLRVTFPGSPFFRSSIVITKDTDSVDSTRPIHCNTSERRVGSATYWCFGDSTLLGTLLWQSLYLWCWSRRSVSLDNRNQKDSEKRVTVWVPGGVYSPWITTMSSGRTVTECELDTSGLQPMFHHENRGKTDGKSWVFMVSMKTRFVTWYTAFFSFFSLRTPRNFSTCESDSSNLRLGTFSPRQQFYVSV